MSKGGIWNLQAIAEQNPISPEESMKRTVVAEGENFTALLLQAQPQKSAYLHTHNYHDELIFVLQGEGEFILADTTKKVSPGDLIYVPRGTVHGPRIPVNGIRLAIYGPRFDLNNPDRVEVGSAEE